MATRSGSAAAKKEAAASRRRKAPRTGVSLEAALGSAGIEAAPADFLGMIREAVASIRDVPAPDPREELSATEAAVLERGGFDMRRPRRGEGKPLDSTVAVYVAMMDDALSVVDAAKRLHVDQSRVRQLLSAGSLYGVKVRGEWRLPSFQFTRRGTVTGIQEVLRALPRDLHPVEVLRWLRNPDPDLEVGDHAVSPLDWLHSGGDPDRASDVARDL